MLPFFYHQPLPESPGTLLLDEATSRHCVQVLRMQAGAQMLLTDGEGGKATATILAPDRKKCLVRVAALHHTLRRPVCLSIGIALTRNKARNEWFLEKATELGVEHIFPLISERSEKEKFNAERYRQILIAAMLQSQQVYLPELHLPQKLSGFLRSSSREPVNEQKFIAHCLDDKEKLPLIAALEKEKHCLMLIGPEGDFTPEEVAACREARFGTIGLGVTRLRTETAGLYACTVFNAFHYG